MSKIAAALVLQNGDHFCLQPWRLDQFRIFVTPRDIYPAKIYPAKIILLVYVSSLIQFSAGV